MLLLLFNFNTIESVSSALALLSTLSVKKPYWMFMYCPPSKFTFPRWGVFDRASLRIKTSVSSMDDGSAERDHLFSLGISLLALRGSSCFMMFRRIQCTRLYAPLTSTSVAMSSRFMIVVWALGRRRTSSNQRC